jgi:hypothetical protein
MWHVTTSEPNSVEGGVGHKSKNDEQRSLDMGYLIFISNMCNPNPSCRFRIDPPPESSSYPSATPNLLFSLIIPLL